MAIVLILLTSYFIGSFPTSYLLVRLLKGIDIRDFGSGNVGATNTFRVLGPGPGILVLLIDMAKGAVPVSLITPCIADCMGAGLDLAWLKILSGICAIAGHNWSIFLHFSGGRGIGTALGVILIVPMINSLTYWDVITFAGTIIAGTIILRSSPLPVFIALISVPITSLRLNEPIEITLGFLAIFVIVIIKRVAAQRPAIPNVTKGQLLLNRLLFDRDIRDKKAWMYRKPAREEKQEEDLV